LRGCGTILVVFGGLGISFYLGSNWILGGFDLRGTRWGYVSDRVAAFSALPFVVGVFILAYLDERTEKK
jgi:hypothetical protein